MKRAILLLIFFATATTYSQIVNIPDPVFKAMLLAEELNINTNGDDEIQLSEAEAAFSVLINNAIDNPNKIESLEGIQYFVNINHLEFQNHSVDSVDLTMLPNLSQLVCDGNGMNSLNVAGLSNLVHLWIMRNNISTLDLSGLDNLEWLWTDDNPISELDIVNLANLERIWCNNNNLAELDFLPLHNVISIRCGDNRIDKLEVNHLTELSLLFCEQNLIASIDLDGLEALTSLNISDNLITHLDVSQTGVRLLQARDNPYLSHIFTSNGFVSMPNQFNFNNLPQLEYVCIDLGEEAAVDVSGYNPSAAVLSGTGCSLSIGENIKATSVAIVPNPVLHSVDIKLNFDANSFHIYDISGKRIVSLTDEAATEAVIAALSSGLYFLTVDRDNTTIVQKFVKN